MTGGLALVVRRTIRATAARLFEAWTSAEQLAAWWGPEGVRCTHAEVDARPGGRYRIANLLPDGSTTWISGEFITVDPDARLVFTWRIEQSEEEPSRVTVRFEPRGDATEVVVVHERIASEATRESHQHGWGGCLDGLAAHLG